MDNNVIDELIPEKDMDTLKEEAITQLQESGFEVKRFVTGGIFNSMLMIILKIEMELITLLRTIFWQMFVSTATGGWLDLKGADYSKKRKEALKARGYVTLSRSKAGAAVIIPKGTIFKTSAGLRFYAVDDTEIPGNVTSGKVLVEAERSGTGYNVASGQITSCLIYLEVDSISNATDWITQAGTEKEDDTSFRNRILNSWSELSSSPTADKYKSVAETVPGVLFVEVDDQHPRGQGTIDIIVTSTTGDASDELLDQVGAAVEDLDSGYDNVLVKSSTTVTADISMTILLNKSATATNTEVIDTVKEAIAEMLKITTGRPLNELYIVDIIYAAKTSVSNVKNITISAPSEDLSYGTGYVIVPGTIEVIVNREAI